MIIKWELGSKPRPTRGCKRLFRPPVFWGAEVQKAKIHCLASIVVKGDEILDQLENWPAQQKYGESLQDGKELLGRTRVRKPACDELFGLPR